MAAPPEALTPALERCVGDAERFLADDFGRRATLRPGDAGTFDDLLSLETVDTLLTTSGLRVPALRVVKNGAPIPAKRWTTSARIGGVPMRELVDPRRLMAEFDDGATIALQGLQRYWSPLRTFCRELEVELGHPCQANAYLTPAGAQGLALHHDGHDVFVLQIFGSKHWEVHDGDEVRQVDLRPGDCLYLPAGTRHAARAQEAASGHITVGVLATSWRSMVERVVAAALEDPGFEAGLPAGWHRDPDRFAEALADRLTIAIERLTKLDTPGVARREADEFLRSRHPLVAGTFAARTRAGTGVDESTRVRRRPGAVAELRPGADDLVLLIGDRELHMPSWVEPAVRTVVDGDVHAVVDVPSLDTESALVLVRRLVREGVLEVVT
jgi:mannose-6-phosphate isomerase-like protein (cupin superfamily)